MNWLVDNASGIYILIGMCAAGLATLAWLNRQTRFVYYTLGVLGFLGVLWLIANYIPSDRRQIEENVHAMKDALVARKPEELMKHISEDFRYRKAKRDQLADHAQGLAHGHRIRSVRIYKFVVDELSRDKKFAKTRFRVTAWPHGSDQPFIFSVQAEFVLEGEQWLLKTVRFYQAFFDEEREVDLPVPH